MEKCILLCFGSPILCHCRMGDTGYCLTASEPELCVSPRCPVRGGANRGLEIAVPGHNEFSAEHLCKQYGFRNQTCQFQREVGTVCGYYFQ